MNARDSEALACLLEMNGYLESEDESTADILIFNTCSVRDQAERKVIGKVGLMKRLKRDRPDLVIGIIGCMAQRLGGVLLEKLPHLDFVAGTDQLQNIPGIVAECLAIFLFASVKDFGFALSLALLCGLVFARQNVVAIAPCFIVANCVFALDWWTLLFAVTPIVLLFALYAVVFALRKNTA